ncbi:hypothetical protein V5P93_001249 [Actinokineospora auranticolor]|uniref:DUF6923 domain-containing protein n=1 Tax=Actinokineospora auranticolor TaxID=155976 RepID=A0A2S6GUK7_9PSEU|nr:hypothetical protein [Actinokineospora auranticolor]PPK68877.1 hypothetical protein CLV40_104121 [Actinokineospora auranticolor]
MNRRATLAGTAALAVVLAGGAVLTGVTGGESRAAQPGGPDCVFYRVHSTDYGLSVLSSVDLADNTITRVGTLGYRVNALGYSARRNTLWGLASRNADGVFADGAHVVAIGGDGSVADLGPVRRLNPGQVPDLLRGATAGAVVGDRLVVRDGVALFQIDIDPDSSTYLSLVGVRTLSPAPLANAVDDFDVRDGEAYGVSNADPTVGQVVRIDLDSGQVSRVDAPGLPGGTSYGMVVLGTDGALYAASNRQLEQSVLYRVGLAPGAPVTTLTAWPAVSSSDATSCLPGMAPATTPPPTPPPSPQPPAPAPTTRAPAISTTRPPISPTPIPIVPPPPPTPDAQLATTAAPQAPPPIPPAPSARRFRAVATTTPPHATRRARTATQEKRRWGVTVLVLVLGGAAAAGASRARRR